MPRALAVSGMAASVIETDVLDAAVADDEEMAPIRAAWTGRALAIPADPAGAEALAAALCALSNKADDLAREPALAAEERRVYTVASASLATLMSKVRQAAAARA